MLLRTMYNLKLILYKIFHLIFLNHDWSQVTETERSETMDGVWEGLVFTLFLNNAKALEHLKLIALTLVMLVKNSS